MKRELSGWIDKWVYDNFVFKKYEYDFQRTTCMTDTMIKIVLLEKKPEDAQKYIKVKITMEDEK